MKVKRYIGDTMQDAVFKVKADLGAEALILHTRKIKDGGIFGFFGKKMFEVIATVEDNREDEVTKELRQELNSLRSNIHKLEEEKETTQKKRSYTPEIPGRMKQMLFPGKMQKYAEKLNREGVEFDLINDLCGRVMENLKIHQIHDDEAVFQALEKEILEKVKVATPIEKYQSGKIVAFIGPTGVGKTTTIAKLAAKAALEGNKSVGLITADTYRIAAVEQLKTYSDIIDVPLKVVYNSEELEKALQELNFCDLIFIDTAGRSQKNQGQMEELKSILPTGLVDETHLVVALNTCYDDLMDSIEKFGQLSLSSLIFTKEDETSKRGIILNIMEQTPFKVSYITNGQDVPEDIKRANPHQIAKMILKG